MNGYRNKKLWKQSHRDNRRNYIKKKTFDTTLLCKICNWRSMVLSSVQHAVLICTLNHHISHWDWDWDSKNLWERFSVFFFKDSIETPHLCLCRCTHPSLLFYLVGSSKSNIKKERKKKEYYFKIFFLISENSRTQRSASYRCKNPHGLFCPH